MIQASKAVIRKSIPTVFVVATIIALMIGASGSNVAQASQVDKGLLKHYFSNNG
jgi:hypothetical protein